MKKILSLFIISLCIVMASCSKNDDVTSTESFTSSMVNKVTSPTGAISIYQGSYTFDIDLVAMKMTITAKDVQFSARMPKVTFVMKDIPFTFDSKKGYVIASTNITPEVDGSPMTSYNISSISGTIYPTTKDSEGYLFAQVPSLQYTVSGFTMTATPASMIFHYSNSTAVTGGSSTFNTSNSAYTVNFDPVNLTATLNIKDAQFASQMPAMNMQFAGLTVTPSATGFSLSSTELTPSVIGSTGALTPYPNYKISNFSATVIGSKFTATFTCTITDAKNTAIGSYQVTASGSLYPY